MGVILVLFTLLTLTIEMNLKDLSHSSSAIRGTPIDRIVQEILGSSNFHEAIMVIHTPPRAEAQERIVDRVSTTVSRTLPTVLTRIPSTFENDRPMHRAATRSLIIYFYISDDPPNSRESKKIQNNTRFLVREGHWPRILLLLTLTGGEENDLEPLLRVMWADKLLDVTILEVSNRDTGKNDATVHQFDPFKGVYRRTAYSSATRWFPDKLTDMQGYPITVDVLSRPAHSTVKRDANGDPVSRTGPDADLLDAIKRAMNFTAVFYRRKNERHEMTVVNGTIGGNTGLLQRGRIDVLFTSIPYTANGYSDLLGRTQPINSEKWCVVIPRMRASDHSAARHLVGLVLATIAIVATFRASARVLRFDEATWRPSRFGRILLATCSPRAPRKTAERILFAGGLAVSFQYSLHLYAELAKVNFQTRLVVNFATAEELRQSGLSFLVTDEVWKIVLLQFGRDHPWVSRTMLRIDSVEECIEYTMKHRNVSCLGEQTRMADFVLQNFRKRNLPLTFTDLCLWTPPVGFLFHKRSPYVRRVERIVARVHEAGIHARSYMEYFRDFRQFTVHPKPTLSLEETATAKGKLAFITVAGCALSFLVFLGELAVDRYRRTRRRERRP